MTDKEKILIDIRELNKSGYAGILSNGNIVDRRKYPDAIAIQENKMFSIPKPKTIFNCLPISDLFKELGYEDPAPNAGRHNKKAIKLRSEAVKKLNIKQYQVGTFQHWDKDGYFKGIIYFYKGKHYE